MWAVFTSTQPYRDYHGAIDSGMNSLLIRRPGPEGEEEAKVDGEDLRGVVVVANLLEVVDWVERTNRTSM